MKKYLIILMLCPLLSYSQTRTVEAFRKAKIEKYETSTEPALLCLCNFLIIDGIGLALSVLTGDTFYLAAAGVTYMVVSIITIKRAKKWNFELDSVRH